jgi:hypothetical protein
MYLLEHLVSLLTESLLQLNSSQLLMMVRPCSLAADSQTELILSVVWMVLELFEGTDGSLSLTEFHKIHTHFYH